jgi:hypothetical protein
MARKEQIRDVFERVAKLADEVGLLDDSELALCEGGSRESGVPWTVYYTARPLARVDWLPGDGVLGYHKPTVLERLEGAERVLRQWAER